MGVKNTSVTFPTKSAVKDKSPNKRMENQLQGGGSVMEKIVKGTHCFAASLHYLIRGWVGGPMVGGGLG